MIADAAKQTDSTAFASAPCITTVTAPRCMSDRVTTRMDSAVPTVLTPLGESMPMRPVTIIGATGSSMPQSATNAKYMRAVNCATSSAELCVKKILINGVEAQLVPGYTGSCIASLSQVGFLGEPTQGCTQSMGLKMEVQLPDYVVLFSDRSNRCMHDGSLLDCISQQVEIVPNPTLANVPRIKALTLEMQLPTGDFGTQMGVVGSNGKVENFRPSVLNGNVMHVEISNPQRNIAKSAAGTTGWCPWWTVNIESCPIAETTTEVNYDPRFFFYPAPLKNIKISSEGIVEPNPNGIGSYFSTDAQHLGLSSIDFDTGGYGVKIAGPHSSSLGGLNESYLETYWPAAYVLDNFGLKPSEANSNTLRVQRTLAKTSTDLKTIFIPTADGLKIVSSGITFSSPTISTRRIFVARKSKSATRPAIFLAAGLRAETNLSKATISVPRTDRSRVSILKESVRFLKTGPLNIVIAYTNNAGIQTSRTLQVLVK